MEFGGFPISVMKETVARWGWLPACSMLLKLPTSEIGEAKWDAKRRSGRFGDYVFAARI